MIGNGSRGRKGGKMKTAGRIARITMRIILILAETAVLACIALYGVMFVLAKGPSPTAAKLFVMSVRETSAIGFIANIFYTDEEIAAMEAKTEMEYVPTDTSLININTEKVSSGTDGAPATDAWGLADEDGDGIIVDLVRGEGYSGYMMVVLDPSRVIVGSDPNSYRIRGYTVAEFVEQFDAVAGTNAGGFYDPDGHGNGSIPDSLVVFDGTSYYAGNGCRGGFAGIDSNNILHVASSISQSELEAADIQYGVCFGPVLVVNGEGVDPDSLPSGLNPRTAIGQRSDGAMLLLVIDGRQTISLGASYQDEVDIMLRYGAVNACNLDGGSSSMMWYEDGYLNNCASVVGIRPVPTAFVVMKAGAEG